MKDVLKVSTGRVHVCLKVQYSHLEMCPFQVSLEHSFATLPCMPPPQNIQLNVVMLKSTHQPAPKLTEQPLPSGWTEHKAPSGHSYYYHAETRQSTYARPQVFIPPAVQVLPVLQHNFAPTYASPTPEFPRHDVPSSTGANRTPVADFRNRQPRPQPQDRPKSKHAIPNCSPWLLIKTRLGRRFVHNPETQESFWKYPKEVLAGVIELDIQERKKTERAERGELEEAPTLEGIVLGERPVTNIVDEAASAIAPHIVPVVTAANEKAYDSDEYEEVEVTDEEDVLDGEDDGTTDGIPKRRKINYDEPDSDAEAAAAAALEFTEDDMAAQLAAMGATYDLAPDEYGAGEEAWDEGDEPYDDADEMALEATAADATASFTDMLDEHAVDPYKPWDAIIALPTSISSVEPSILSDARYTLLPTMRARRAVFTTWSAARIANLRALRSAQAKTDPRAAYLALLSQHASPKLYWPEFKRKFKKEAAMRDLKLADRERERLYREHVARVTRMGERELRGDLEALLKEVPVSATWNRDVSASGDGDGGDMLPESVVTNVRYISLKPSVRDAVVREFIRRLPRDVEVEGEGDVRNHATVNAAEQKRMQALRERERAVDEAKRRQQKELQYGRSRLREEQNLDRAMKVGKTGLKRALGTDDEAVLLQEAGARMEEDL